jgi:tRNA U38,U39,U40 pseudouridine synthase TruA
MRKKYSHFNSNTDETLFGTHDFKNFESNEKFKAIFCRFIH